MYVDLENSPCMNARLRECHSNCGSPRLQHRVPIFMDGYDQPIRQKSEPQGENVDGSRKPSVRVVPIKIEGANSNYSRHRNFSGPVLLPGMHNEQKDFTPPATKRLMPNVCNIPVKIEGMDNTNESKKAFDRQKSKSTHSLNRSDQNKSAASAVFTASHKIYEDKLNATPKLDLRISLEKISKVHEEIDKYKSEVENFSGTAKEKRYKYLDEMLTRCMLNLDNVETMGDKNVRCSRKAAIKEVQALIDLLESKLVLTSAENTQSHSIASKSVSENSNCTSAEQNSICFEERESVNDVEMENEKALINVLRDAEMQPVANEEDSETKVSSTTCVLRNASANDFEMESKEKASDAVQDSEMQLVANKDNSKKEVLSSSDETMQIDISEKTTNNVSRNNSSCDSIMDPNYRNQHHEQSKNIPASGILDQLETENVINNVELKAEHKEIQDTADVNSSNMS